METATNHAAKYASKVLRDKHALVMSKSLQEDYQLLTTSAIYLKSFICPEKDLSIMQNLASDLDANAAKTESGFIEWSQHQKHEDPDSLSPTFRRVVELMAKYFDVEVYATRLNYYADGSSWKPFHHDSHAGRQWHEHGGKGPREDFTMGASFGASRELAFLHVESDARFSFPQCNGDVFAFDSAVNQRFQHGVPKGAPGATLASGPRFSIIAWGRRVLLTPRNGAPPALQGSRDERGQLVLPPGVTSYLGAGSQRAERENAPGADASQVSAAVDAFAAEQERKEAKAKTSKGKNNRTRNARIKQ
jgi:hypothetical protein